MGLGFHGLIILLSVLAIVKGADWLTDSLIPVAKKLGVSGVSVGLVLVSVAVSLPEILVAIYTQVQGYPGITIGIILGSIFCNIGLMTGLSAIVRPLKVNQNLILRDGIFSLVVPILVFAVGSSGHIGRFEGFAFFLLFIPYLVNVFLLERRETPEQKVKEVKEMEIELDLIGLSFGKIKSGYLSFFAGLAVLVVGAQFFSNELISLAGEFRVNEVLIGLTLGAIGPSIPNIMASYNAAKRGMGEIAISETLGSNIFTLLVTLGIAAMISPIVVSSQWLRFDLPALVLLSALLFIFIITRREISRKEGMVLLGSYLAVLALQIGISLK